MFPLLVLLSSTVASSPVFAQTTERASVSTSGAEGHNDSGMFGPSISADGRFVAFETSAGNLVPQGVAGIVVRDLRTGRTELASVSSSGTPASGGGSQPSISGDGRFVAFISGSDDLVPGDTNANMDVFVHDRLTGITERVSVAADGTQGNRYSRDAAISADGRTVAFRSWSSNLVPGDTNDCEDIFVRDLLTGAIERVSVDSNGVEGNSSSLFPALSADGRFVAFYSFASNLVPGDTNHFCDTFVHDRRTGATERVSIAGDGRQGNERSGYWYESAPPSISADGRFVTFYSSASDFVAGDVPGTVDTFLRDRLNRTTERIGRLGYVSSISADGRFVAFGSVATDVVPGDTNGFADVFVRDRELGVTERVSLSTSGAQGDDECEVGPYNNVSISADGRRVAFVSLATNLVPGDTNGWADVFVRDRGDAATFAPFCAGDGSGAACPCANSGAIGHGCENSASTGGALLTANGAASLSSDSVQLTSAGEPADAFCIVLQGRTAIGAVSFGDGLLCTGGPLTRLFLRRAAGGSLVVPRGTDPSLSARSAARGDPIPLGATRNYQVHYRDPSASFCPNPQGGAFNVSNAIAIAWGA
jgi:Tol biopolymer transport system component